MITTRATNVITKAEEKLSSHSIEPPPENKKNTVLVMNTVNDETNVDLITEFKETPNVLVKRLGMIGLCFCVFCKNRDKRYKSD